MPIGRSSNQSSVAYTAQAMSQTRIDKTIGKLRAGALPAPTVLRRFMTGGLGGPCSGCGEKIGRFDHCYFIRVADGDGLRFHLVCHETWARFKRPTEGRSPSSDAIGPVSLP